MRDDGADGASDLRLLQMPTKPSVDAERMRDEWPWTARDSTLPLCPYSSSDSFRSAEKLSSVSEYFQSLIVRSRPQEAICVGVRNLAALILKV